MNVIRSVNAIRNVPHSKLNLLVKNVVVILCNSRSGSSLLKSVLDAHPDIASLDGEIEPYLELTGNGFGYTSTSDKIEKLRNKNYLIDNIMDDFSIFSKKIEKSDLLAKRWAKRLLLQFPEKFSSEPHFEKLIRDLHDIFEEKKSTNTEIKKICSEIDVVLKIFSDESWRAGYYDGDFPRTGDRWFDERIKIEEPPFITPRSNRVSLNEKNIIDKILIFKNPADAYRIGIYEELFPEADIKYIHLTRGYAQSVNGLMDGWLSPVGFFSHNIRKFGFNLNIEGYSNSVPFGKKWWKFDLPPNWQDFATAKLEDVCLNQWISAHTFIALSNTKRIRISFENFLVDPGVEIRRIANYLNIDKMRLPECLPVLMATEKPKSQRWKKRSDLIIKMGDREEVIRMMESLGYEMNPGTWI